MDRFTLVYEENGIEYLIYKPSLLKLYADCYSKQERPSYYSRIIHKIRMARELILAHYVIVYLRKCGRIVGHIVVSRGGTRIVMSTKDDIVLVPIWIVPNERGKGIASEAIHHVLSSLDFSFTYAYEFIEGDNISSVRTVEKNGYSFIGFGKEQGLFRTIVNTDKGKWKIFRYGE